MLEPTTFPITMPGEPSKIAIIDETNSGKEVPRATTVTPITKEGIPRLKPIFSAELINCPAE